MKRLRRNTDTRVQRLKRRAHEEGGVDVYAALLQERARVGEVTLAQIELAAALGREDAAVLFPDVARVQWSDLAKKRAVITSAQDLLGDVTLPARVAADWAEHVLNVFEEAHPEDDLPRRSIEAARAWAQDPTDTALAMSIAMITTRGFYAYEMLSSALPGAAGNAAIWAAKSAEDTASVMHVEDGDTACIEDAVQASEFAWSAEDSPVNDNEKQRLCLAAYVLEDPRLVAEG